MLQPRVSFTPAAEKFMRRLVRFSAHPAGALRLSATPGGCSGYTFDFTVEAAPRSGDPELTVNGLRVFLTAESCLLLDGVTVDFADTPLQSGLIVIDQNAENRGCSGAGPAGAPAEASISLSSIRRRVA